jgi:hypothetical protein
MKTRINRDTIVSGVADSLPYSSVNDLPMIRQAVNDLSDMYRKEGHTVPDFAQDAIVRSIQREITHNTLNAATSQPERKEPHMKSTSTDPDDHKDHAMVADQWAKDFGGRKVPGNAWCQACSVPVVGSSSETEPERKECGL